MKKGIETDSTLYSQMPGGYVNRKYLGYLDKPEQSLRSVGGNPSEESIHALGDYGQLTPAQLSEFAT